MAVAKKKKVSRKAKTVTKAVKKTAGKKFSVKTTAKKRFSRKLDESKLQSMIQERAYYIWEEKGKPSGQDYEIWVQAKRDICAMMGQ